MRLNPKTSQKIVGFFALLIVSSLLLFQNCDQPLPGNEDHLNSFFQTLPFAYDAQIDTLAYMSCDGLQSSHIGDGSPIFTFYAGALRPGSGVRLTTEFLHETRYLEIEDKIRSLRQSSLNGDAQAQLWVRTAAQLQTAYTPRSPRVGVDFDNILNAPLDHPELAAQLVEQRGQRLNLFQGSGPAEHLRFEGRIRWGDIGSESREKLRRNLGGVDFGGFFTPKVLTLNYHAGIDDVTAKTSESRLPNGAFPGQSIYGVGFRNMRFIRGRGLSGNQYAVAAPSRVLDGLVEFNLDTGQPTGGNWVCPAELRFMIVRASDILNPHEDQHLVSCPKSFEHEISSRVRAVLPNNWEINLGTSGVRPCVYLKQESENLSCYPSRIQTINYASGECDPNGNTNACPHFVSICLRQ